MTKVCYRCEQDLDIDEFYAHPYSKDGHMGKCKVCARKDAATNRQNKSEAIREYDRNRNRLPHRVAKRIEWAKQHPSAVAVIHNRWVCRNPEKVKAEEKLNNALRANRLSKMPCLVCNSAEVEAHHEDYSKPLEVVWLCKKHHVEADAKRREREREKHIEQLN